MQSVKIDSVCSTMTKNEHKKDKKTLHDFLCNFTARCMVRRSVRAYVHSPVSLLLSSSIELMFTSPNRFISLDPFKTSDCQEPGSAPEP